MNPVLLRGAAMILDLIFIALIATYLIRETRRRNLNAVQWVVHLPPPMHFAVAVIVFDVGLLIYLIGISLGTANIRLVGVSMILIGSLCKIRSISKPDYGDAPWLLAAAVVMVFALSADLLGFS